MTYPLERLASPVNDTSKIYIVDKYADLTSLKDVSKLFKGKSLFIDLWATWCEPCLKNMPVSDSLSEALLRQNIQLVYVSFDKESEDKQWKEIISHLKIAGAHIRAGKMLQDDITKAVWNGIDVYSIPHYIIVDQHGSVLLRDAPSPKDHDRFNAALNTLQQ